LPVVNFVLLHITDFDGVNHFQQLDSLEQSWYGCAIK